MLRGMKETRTWTNDYKDITNVQLSVDLYVARGYFERLREDLDNIEEFSQASEEIKGLLNRAAVARIDAVNLYTSGFLLKEQIGKTLLSNFLTDKDKTRTLPIPQYHGEIEEGLSKIPLANSFVVEALEKMKMITDEARLGHFYDSTIASLIGYYSETIDTDFDSYIREGRNFSDTKDYYKAISAYSKALRVKPQDKDSLLALAQAYVGIGDTEKAEGILAQAKQLYPEDKSVSALDAAVNPSTKP
jgi:tetratricopeptide (TPR) repeat protein